MEKAATKGRRIEKNCGDFEECKDAPTEQDITEETFLMIENSESDRIDSSNTKTTSSQALKSRPNGTSAVNVLINPLEDVEGGEDEKAGAGKGRLKVQQAKAPQKNSYVCINLAHFNEDLMPTPQTTVSQESINVLKPLFYVEYTGNQNRDASNSSLNTFDIENGVKMRLKNKAITSEKNLFSVAHPKNDINAVKADSNSRLSAVARNVFQRRRSHQSCLISTVNENEELNGNGKQVKKSTEQLRNELEKKDPQKRRKGGGIEAMLRQSCVDVRNLIVGDGNLFSASPNLPTPMTLFHKGRRQSTTALFQPGPRISPLPFENANGVPGSVFMRMNFPHGQPIKHPTTMTNSTGLTTPASLTGFAPPAIVCDGVLTMPTSPCDATESPKNYLQQLTHLPNPSSATHLEPSNLNSSRNSAVGSQQHLSGQRRRSMMITPRSSFLVSVSNQPSLDFRDSELSINYPDCYDEAEELSLIYLRLERIPVKDFAAEIRAHLDVEHFLNQAQLMLDLEGDDMDGILDSMLKHLLEEEVSVSAYIEAKKALFSRDASTLSQRELKSSYLKKTLIKKATETYKHTQTTTSQKGGPMEQQVMHPTRPLDLPRRKLHQRPQHTLSFPNIAAYIAHQLAKTIQCTCSTYSGGYDYDPSWVCVLCTVPSVQKRHVAIARLKQPASLGKTCSEVLFIILVVTSTKEKGTKTALETGRTFSTLFADFDLRMRLLVAQDEQEFKQLMWEHMKDLAEEQQCIGQVKNKRRSKDSNGEKSQVSKKTEKRLWIGQGLKEDWKRRSTHYLSDFTDGFCGSHTLHKTLSSTFFLYFACILPSIALGVLYYSNTSGPDGKGHIDVKKVIYSQTIAGLVFAMFGGQPMVILMTTAPLAIYTKVVYNICEDWKLDFHAMFACTGLWNSFFLLLYAITDASKLMKWCTRSTEEIFALFISLALAVDAFKNVVYDFNMNYHSPACYQNTTQFGGHNYSHSPTTTTTQFGGQNYSNFTMTTSTTAAKAAAATSTILSEVAKHTPVECLRENSLLYLLLMLGTAWLSLSLYNFTKTPFLNASKRELMADCALPVSVLLMAFFGSYLFRDVKLKKFNTIEGNIFTPAPLHKLEWLAILGGMALGFCLSLLFFMDHYIAGALVNSTDNRLKKGSAYHWDLMIIGFLNAFLSFFGLPLVHGALPHSPLHVRAMADVEDRVYQGHVYLKIIKARETRVTGICAHILIGLSILYIEELKKIPRPVLDGLFLYLAITALHSNQLFERIMLMVTEQAAYPPNHYIRTVPQRKMHLFTLLQILQLAVLCGFGFSAIPYLKMVFPILHLVMLPVRHKLVPCLIEKKYLHSLDGH